MTTSGMCSYEFFVSYLFVFLNKNTHIEYSNTIVAHIKHNTINVSFWYEPIVKKSDILSCPIVVLKVSLCDFLCINVLYFEPIWLKMCIDVLLLFILFYSYCAAPKYYYTRLAEV